MANSYTADSMKTTIDGAEVPVDPAGYTADKALERYKGIKKDFLYYMFFFGAYIAFVNFYSAPNQPKDAYKAVYYVVGILFSLNGLMSARLMSWMLHARRTILVEKNKLSNPPVAICVKVNAEMIKTTTLWALATGYVGVAAYAMYSASLI